jgi:acyl transferase domain-containing protein/3-hydroxymyristoyl/3-hydroxydecanoyl-(acyl carrier protein) dehydratase
MEPIAIVGLGCLFPDAATPQAFWQNLLDGRQSVSDATASELGVDPRLLFDPRKGELDKSYCQRGGYLRGFRFAPDGYCLPREQLLRLDPSGQWALYVARQALQDSGTFERTAVLERCGVILGKLSFPTRQSARLCNPLYDLAVDRCLPSLLPARRGWLSPLAPPADRLPEAMLGGTVASLVAGALGLGGPRFCLDAACASSLYAIKLACDLLEAGQVDLMLAGAVSGAHPHLNIGFSRLQVFPEPGQSSSPLDQSSGGMYVGEGAGAVVLKRLTDAQRDGDRVYATILGLGLSNDGRGRHPLAPNQRGQLIAFERAYAATGVDPATIDYLECHATGLPTGDQTELEAIAAFFGAHDASPLLGAVKANLGHLLTAAGLAGLLKVLLSMSFGLVPATPRLEAPRASTDGAAGGGHIVARPIDWPRAERRRAAIDAFGFGGTNAHLIVEQGVAMRPAEARKPTGSTRLAIVGMDVHFGSCEGLAAYARTIFQAEHQASPLPPERWRGLDGVPGLLEAYGLPAGPPSGNYLATFEVNSRRYRTPPNSDDRPVPHQLLLLKVADNALRDAQIGEGGNVAVIVATGTELPLHQFVARVDSSWRIREALGSVAERDPELAERFERLTPDSLYEPPGVNHCTRLVGNITANEVSALWDFSGPSFTLAAEEAGVFRALEIARVLLANGEVEAVVVGAVDLAGGPESVLLRHARLGDQGFVGEGAAAIVLERSDQARAAGHQMYATLETLALAEATRQAAWPPEPLAERVVAAARRALEVANLTPDGIGYIELATAGRVPERQAALSGLHAAFGPSPAGANWPIGSASLNVGYSFAAAGMASLARAALVVQAGRVPATPAASSPPEPEACHPFIWPAATCAWPTGASDRRYAAVTALSEDGTCAQALLSSPTAASARALPAPPGHGAVTTQVVLGGRRLEEVLRAAPRPPLPPTLAERAIGPPSPAVLGAQLGVVRAHEVFLSGRHDAFRGLGGLVQRQLQSLRGDAQASAARRPARHQGVIWDQADLLEIAGGSLARVFGPAYAVIDGYRRRVRLPLPPYLLVSRVVGLAAEPGRLGPASIVTEYDPPLDAWYAVDGRVPWGIVIEAGQSDLLLASYLGIDFQNRGERVYRLLNSTVTFFDDLPLLGQSLRYEIRIDSFMGDGDTTLFFFSYDCSVEGRPLARLEGGCAGFFTDQQLAGARGLIRTPGELAARARIRTDRVSPPLTCRRTSFDRRDLLALSAGDLAACFGPEFDQRRQNPGVRLPPPQLLMIDRVTSVDVHGGPSGLGLVVAEKDLRPDDWYFRCHFPDDPVLAGSLVGEGCCQLLQFYVLFLGLASQTRASRFQPLKSIRQSVRCRGQATPADTRLQFRLEVSELALTPSPYARASADVVSNGKVIATLENFGVRLAPDS